jgi:uncharacterized membrane protein YGL010W
MEPMKTLTQQLSMYASYHRDRRNIATHFVGIPMIVAGVATLLARPTWLVGGLPLSPMVAATALSLVFYFALDVRFGLAMTVFMGLAGWAGASFAAQSTALWLTAGLGLFVVGWAIQFVGHIFEGKKPAFMDDIAGFLVGPLFIVAEWAFAVGFRKPLLAEIEKNAGPTRAGRAAPSTSTAA